MYNLLTSNQQTSQSMYGFKKPENTRILELTNNKTEEGTLFVTIKLKIWSDLLIKKKNL